MRKYATDQFACDLAKIISENDRFLKIRAAITAVGVYQYPDGLYFKSRRALLSTTFTARYAKLTVGDHPASMVVMSQKDIVGGLEKPFFERDRVWAVLTYDKKRTPKKYLDQLHDPNLIADVSIGFYFSEIPEKGTWNGKPYDYRMEDIVIDHVATFVRKGRCSFPTCGIGVDSIFSRLKNLKVDKVVKRGNQWCIIHTHGEKAGTLVPGSCHSDKSKTEAMHRAIEARKHAALYSVSSMEYEQAMEKYFKGVDQDQRPPKEWWDNCEAKAETFATDPGKFCGWLWHNATGHWTKIRESFGKASIGGRKRMAEKTPEQEAAELERCITERMEMYPEMTREEAEALCKVPTTPEDQPTPPGGTLTDQEQSPWQACIIKHTDAGMSLQEAIDKCKEEGVVKTDQDAAFENCVNRKVEGGMSREDAEKECRVEHPVAEEDQEEEATPLEKCVDTKMEEGMTAEEAKEWCEAELAGEHELTEDALKRSKELLKMKAHKDKTGMSY